MTVDNKPDFSAHVGTRIYFLMPTGEKATILVPHGSKNGGTVHIKSKSSDKVVELSENVAFRQLGRMEPFTDESKPTYKPLLDMLLSSTAILVKPGFGDYQLRGFADAYSAFEDLCRSGK